MPREDILLDTALTGASSFPGFVVVVVVLKDRAHKI